MFCNQVKSSASWFLRTANYCNALACYIDTQARRIEYLSA